jgi:hypothetical protein
VVLPTPPFWLATQKIRIAMVSPNSHELSVRSLLC